MMSCFLASCGVCEHINDASESTLNKSNRAIKRAPTSKRSRSRSEDRIHDSQVPTELILKIFFADKREKRICKQDLKNIF